ARDLYETHVKLAELERVRMDADQAVTSSVSGSSDQDVRPLARLTNDADFDKPSAIDREWARRLVKSAHFAAIEEAYRSYPRFCFTNSIERAFLYSLVRAMKPADVSEIGTAFCGASEIIARALWENGRGVLHTTDPFAPHRCPPVISRWPQPLQEITRFHAKSSMDFYMTLAEAKIGLDIAFVDGNHDFEFAYFDILIAARLLRPGGVIIVDNSEQSGPFYAALQFVRGNPALVVLGG